MVEAMAEEEQIAVHIMVGILEDLDKEQQLEHSVNQLEHYMPEVAVVQEEGQQDLAELVVEEILTAKDKMVQEVEEEVYMKVVDHHILNPVVLA